MSSSTDARRSSKPPRPAAGHRRPSHLLLFLATFALAALPAPRGMFGGSPALSAQSTTEIGAGSRVRVEAPRYGLRSTVALVRDVGPGGVLLDFGDGATLRVEPDAMEQLDVSAGRRDHGTLGLLLGAGLGAAAGAFSGVMSGDDPPCAPARGSGIPIFDIFDAARHRACENGRETANEKAGARALLYGGLAGAVGYLIGRSSTVERWTEVDVGSATFTVQPTVAGSGAGLVVALPMRSP